jgi:hypothetical protein
MTDLILHAPDLHKDSEFRLETTRFRMACDLIDVEYSSNVLTKAKHYNIWNRRSHSRQYSSAGDCLPNNVLADGDDQPHLQASLVNILNDIKARGNVVVLDRLAIFANCCQYHTLLDIPRVERAGYHSSTCFLALYLINEEVLSNNMENQSAKTEEALEYTINKLREEYVLNFDPPCDHYWLSFVDEYCRFDPVKLTTHGTQTHG